MKKDITRAIIDATVDRGLKEIYEDPRRSIRKLAELGKQYNKGRFLQDIYAIFQDMLKNDDSPYYTAIEHLLQNTTRNTLKHTGINIGYNSLTRGAKTIRGLYEKKDLMVPWSIIIRMDPTVKTSVSPHELVNIINQGRKLGIFTYMIRIENSLSDLESLLKIFTVYDDCSFFLVLPDIEIDSLSSNCIRDCKNVIYFVPAFDDSCGSNVRIFKRFKSWYALYVTYDEKDAETIISDETSWEYMQQDSAFLFTIARDNTPRALVKKTGQKIKKARLEPIVPLFMFDIYSDAMEIQKLISGYKIYFEILADGSFHTNTGIYKINNNTFNLEKIFAEYLKKSPNN